MSGYFCDAEIKQASLALAYESDDDLEVHLYVDTEHDGLVRAKLKLYGDQKDKSIAALEAMGRPYPKCLDKIEKLEGLVVRVVVDEYQGKKYAKVVTKSSGISDEEKANKIAALVKRHVEGTDEPPF